MCSDVIAKTRPANAIAANIPNKDKLIISRKYQNFVTYYFTMLLVQATNQDEQNGIKMKKIAKLYPNEKVKKKREQNKHVLPERHQTMYSYNVQCRPKPRLTVNV